MTKDPLTDQLRRIADAVDARGDHRPWEFPHPDAKAIIDRRRVEKKQFSHSVPVELDLHARLDQYCVDHGNPGAGNVVAAVMDAMLRHHGYPPPTKADHETSGDEQ